MNADCVVSMLNELRQQRPPVFMADERERWLSSIGAFIANMTDSAQRMRAINTVALDLWAAYGMRRDVAVFTVQVAVFAAEVRA